MNKTLLASIVLALCSTSSAQSYITSPKGLLKSEGAYHAEWFGAWSNARFQQVDGTHVGSQGYTITKIAFRADNREYYESNGMGRTWSNVSLHVSETDFSKLSSTFSQNIIGGQTRVFDTKWTWQSQVTAPLLRPAAWGGIGGGLSFPFRTPWIYSGSKAMLMDYQFSGGVLLNSARWNLGPRYFFLDGISTLGYAEASTVVLSQNPNRCSDTGSGGPTAPAFMGVYAYLFDDVGEDTLTYSLGFRATSRGTAPTAPVVHAIGLGGNSTGVDIGARCQRLYVDFNKPVVFLNFRADAGGYAGTTRFLPWKGWLSDLQLYAQAAWSDSRTGAFSLTGASKVALPSRQPSSVPPQLRSIHRPLHLAATIGLGPWLDYKLLPVTRYTVR